MRDGAERRYSDRDVRSHPDLERHVRDYLERYTGEFEFLVDMKMRAAAGYEMTVPMVRGVLNCMRNDPRVKDLPAVEYGSAVVVPIRPEPRVCPQHDTEHGPHWFPSELGGQQHCRGWHAFTRAAFRTRARFHAPYLRARASNLVHRSTHEGELRWSPPSHEYGPATPWSWTVGRGCTPGASRLTEPELLDADGVRAAVPHERPVSPRHEEITLCALCFPTGSPDGVTLP